MSIEFIFVILSSVFAIGCFLPYIRDIFKGKTKPHIYSWFIWFILQSIGVLAMYKSGAGLGIASLLIGTIFCFFIFTLSFKYGTKNIKIFDKVCLAGALLSIITYFFLHDILLSVIVITITDFIGFLPTFRKSYEEPDTETSLTYILSALSSTFALFSLAIFSFTTSFYIISLIITNGLCAFIILYRRR